MKLCEFCGGELGINSGALLFLAPFQNGLTETDAAKGVEKRRPRMAARYFSFPLQGKSSREGEPGKITWNWGSRK